MRVLPPVPIIGREAQEDFVYRKENNQVRKCARDESIQIVLSFLRL